MKLLKRILLVALCLCVFGGAAGTFVALKSLPPECTAERKIVHVSIDDCARALARLRDPAVKSIYDDPFFSQLREWHEEFGAKFTCYVYGEIAGFSLSEVPTKFREEFSAASSWLKFGFHAPSSDIEKTRAQTAEEFAENFSRVNAAIDVFAGTNARSTVLRLDYFFAREEWMPAIYSAGTRHLLGPDTAGRKAYALDEAASEELWTHGALPFDRNEQMGGGYIRTDARFEKNFLPWWTLENLRDQERIVVFTHEWAMSAKIRFLMRLSFGWFRDHGYEFTFLENINEY